MTKVESSCGNVYSDLQHADAEEMKIKACLAAKIGEIINSRSLTQSSAAEILGMPQPKLSGMLRGQFRGISETKMLDCLNRLGRDVDIVIRKSPDTLRTRPLDRSLSILDSYLVAMAFIKFDII